MATLEEELTATLLDAYRRAKSEAGYNANAFFGMLSKDGGLLTAKKLINSHQPSDGYTRLYELGRLDLTVEAVVLKNAHLHNLFAPEELRKARTRLTQYHYKGLTD